MSGIDQVGVPKRAGVCPGVAVGVEGVDAVILSRNINHVMNPAGDAHIRNVERLRIYVAVDGLRKFLAEAARSFHYGWSESGFVQVLSGAQNVIVLHEDPGEAAGVGRVIGNAKNRNAADRADRGADRSVSSRLSRTEGLAGGGAGRIDGWDAGVW